MLQINTGKLFSRGISRTNHLRGVLYTNLELPYGQDLVTAAGTLRNTDGRPGNRAIVYEIDENIEAREDGREFLISRTIAPFLEEFSVTQLSANGLVWQERIDNGVVARCLVDAVGNPLGQGVIWAGKHWARLWPIHSSCHPSTSWIAAVPRMRWPKSALCS